MKKVDKKDLIIKAIFYGIMFYGLLSILIDSLNGENINISNLIIVVTGYTFYAAYRYYKNGK